MNIGMVIPWFPSHETGLWSGIPQYHQARKLVERGHKVVVISIRRAGMPEFQNMNGILIYRSPSYTIPSIRYDLPNLIKLNRLITDTIINHRLDLIEFFSSDFLTSVPVFYMKRRMKVPTVVVINGLPGISWFTGSRTIDTLGYIYTNLIGKRIIMSASGIRLLQRSLRDDLWRFSLNGIRAETIHYGVDPEAFCLSADNSALRSDLGLQEENFVVLYVGRLVNPIDMKGTRYLIEAVKDLLPQYRNLRLVIVGDGDGRGKNEEMASSIKANVIFTGYRSDVRRFMGAADVLVLPSLSEGCPNVVLEACACQTPVIASKVGAVPELVKDGETGIIVSPGSVSELKQALIQLMDNPSMRLDMGKRAREYMEKEYTWDIICRRLEEFYLGVIESS